MVSQEVVMHPELSANQEGLRTAAANFARSELSGDIVGRDANQRFSGEDWKRCAAFGVLGMPVPTLFGGSGRRLTDIIAVMEGLGYGSRDQGLLFSINAHLWAGCMPIVLYGTDEQRRKYLPRMCKGELIAANGSSEIDSGSDVFSMSTRAERLDSGYILNGTKEFVTNAPVADVFLVYATVDPKLGAMGVTAFLVDRECGGVTVSGETRKMGLRTSPMATVSFVDCHVPLRQRLGREGRAGIIFGAAMEWERGCILASYLGLMQRQLETCIDRARRRKQFGQAIGKFQSVANRLVNMKIRLDTCKPLVYRVGMMKDSGASAVMEAAIAKLYVSECLVESCMDAMQIHGGYGYLVESGIERELRDACGSTLYSGTSEIQRNVIAKCLGV